MQKICNNFEEIPIQNFDLADTSFQFIKYKEKNINVFRQGLKNGPKLLFLHGFNYFVKMYSTIINELIQQFDVLSLDLPGHGLSDSFPFYDMDLQLDCIRFICAQQQFEDFIIAGHSMGAMISIFLFQSKTMSIKSCVAFAPPGLALEYTIGHIAVQSGLLKKIISQNTWFRLSMKEIENRSHKFYGRYKDALDKVFYEVVTDQKQKYVDRQNQMVSTMPWTKLQAVFKNADSKKLKIIVETTDTFVNTIKMIHFIQDNMTHAQLVIDEGIHKMCILKPKWACQQIVSMIE
uniref:Alpha/beta hydrolase family protein n=1 Tax=Trepomonas sp. PC1 TaxID=1076344 RepID=A0A146KHA4_9EUKA|eukprot:JAP94781.1 Alpha/beta hydrolase family protein [Trepomonas sp. PC1]